MINPASAGSGAVGSVILFFGRYPELLKSLAIHIAEAAAGGDDPAQEGP